MDEAFARNPDPRVASPPARSVLDAWNTPATFKEEAVEDAVETNPAPKVARLPARKVDDAWSGLPATMRPEEKVEEATEMKPPAPALKSPATDDDAAAENPPEASSVNTDEEAVFWTMRAEPVWPVNVFKVRFEAVVEVAAMVVTEFTSALEVPTARLSVKVVSATSVPASVQPAPVVMPAHWGFAEAP